MTTAFNTLRKNFVLQHDQSDCGIACLRNILTFYKAALPAEKLRDWSGTDQQGSSLLGLHLAATKAGFAAQGAEAEGMHNLQEVTTPCILHVTIHDTLLHYVVYYPGTDDRQNNRFLIGDPNKGLHYMQAHELEAIWKSKVVLLLQPTDKLAAWQQPAKKKWLWFKPILQQDMPLLTVALAFGVIVAALNVSTAVFSQRLVDQILPAGDRQKLMIGLLLLGMVLLIKSVVGYIRQQLLVKQGYLFNTRLTGRFFSSLLYLVKSFFDRRQTGDLVSRLNDTLRIQQAVAYVMSEMMIQLLIMLASLIFLFIYAWPIGLFCLLVVPALFALVKFYEKDIIAQQREAMTAHAHNESNYVDNIRYISTIKVMNSENAFVQIANRLFGRFQDAVARVGKTRSRFNLAVEVASIVFLVAVFCWGSLLVLNHSLQTGALIAILQIAGWLMQSAVVVALTNLQVQEARVAFERMYEFATVEKETDEQEAVPATPVTNIDRLFIRNISFRFPGKKLLLRNITLEVKKGEIIALTGESGQGKSTLLQVLQKFYPYENGQIMIDEHPWEKITTTDWRRLIGVVPQDVAVFSGNLLANICMDEAPHHAQQVPLFCERFGFDRFINSLPQGYATLLGEGGVALSGGQKQLLALARCLYRQPQLLLLDEPTAAMDAATEASITRLLQNIKNDVATIIISHKDALTQVADRIYSLQHGTTVLQKPAATPSLS